MYIPAHRSGISEVSLSRMSLILTLLLATVTHEGAAQRIPLTPREAEAEGVRFARGAVPTRMASEFQGVFRGSADRRCVTPYTEEVLDVSRRAVSPLRSGEFIVGYGALIANYPTKIVWMPLHNPSDYPDTLLIRAVRLGHPGDSLRVSVSYWGWSGTRANSGYVSGMSFPSAGTWLVVTTAGNDWGCFQLSVAD
jgi:hypothetical protein